MSGAAQGIIIVIAVVLALGIRVLVKQFQTEQKSSIRLVLGVGMFAIYTGILLLVLYEAYCLTVSEAIAVSNWYQIAALAVVITSVITVFIAVMFYAGAKKKIEPMT